MEEIESFVRKLCAEGDLSVLSKKLVRSQYQAHFNKSSVTREEKNKINEVLDIVIQELAEKDVPTSAEVGGYVYSSPAEAERGKENRRTDYICIPSSASTTSHVRQKVANVVPRADLGMASFGHAHLKHIQVSLNQNGNGSLRRDPKGTFAKACRNSGTNEASQQPCRSSPLRRLSSDSVLSNNTATAKELTQSPLESSSNDDMGVFVNASEGRKVVVSKSNQEETAQPLDERDRAVGCHLASASPVPESSLHDSEGSEDSVALLSWDSDSSACSKKSVPKSCTSKLAQRSGLRSGASESAGKNTGPVTVVRKQDKKVRRMYSVQTALTAIFELDECQKMERRGNEPPAMSNVSGDLTSLTVKRGSGPPSSTRCFDADPVTAEVSVDNSNQHTGCNQTASGYQTTTHSSVDKDSAGKIKRSLWRQHVDIESEDSQDARLVIDETAGMSEAEEDSATRPVQPTQVSQDYGEQNSSVLLDTFGCLEDGIDYCEETEDASTFAQKTEVNAHQNAAKDILKKGFTPQNFFQKRSVHTTPEKKRRRRRQPVIESDSDISQDSMSSPICKRQGRLGFTSQTSIMVENEDSESDILYVEKKSPLAGKKERKMKPSTGLGTHVTSGDGCVTGSDEEEKTTETNKPLNRTKTKHASVTALKKKKRDVETAGWEKGEKTGRVSNDSDLEHLPLVTSQQTGKARMSQSRNITISESDTYRSLYPPRHGSKCNYLTPQKKEKTRISNNPVKSCAANSQCRQSPVLFSPPVSPVVKKIRKKNQTTPIENQKAFEERHVLESQPYESELPHRLSMTSVSHSLENGEMCRERKGSKASLKTTLKTSIPASKKSVHSLSGSLTSEGTCHEKKAPKARQKAAIRSTIAASERSVYSLSDTTEDEAARIPNYRPVKCKLNLRKGKITLATYSEDCLSSEQSLRSLSESRGGEACSSPFDGSVLSEHQGQQREVWDGGEQWEVVTYQGEPLMFPVIMLEDVQRRRPHHQHRETVADDRRHRNIFEVLEPGSNTQQNGTWEMADVSTFPAAAGNDLSTFDLSAKQEHIFCSAKTGCGDETERSPNLDQSRARLKIQRTAKKVAPKLRTTLKLRKQPSPDKRRSAEEEEWTVVIETEDSDENEEERSSSVGMASPQSDRLGRKRSKSKKRKAVSDSSSSDEDDQPLKRLQNSGARCGSDVSDSSDGDAGLATLVHVKKPQRKLVKLQADSSSDEDDVPLKSKSAPVDGMEINSEDDDISCQSVGDDDTPLKVKKPRNRKTKVQIDSSDEEAVPLKPKSSSVDDDGGDNKEDSDTDEEDGKPLQAKKPSSGKTRMEDSSEEDDVPLKVKSGSLSKDVRDSEEHNDADEGDEKPLKTKKPGNRKARIKKDSSEEDDVPLKPKLALVLDSVGDSQEEKVSDKDDKPLAAKKARGRKARAKKDSSEEDDVPLKPKSVSLNSDVGDNQEGNDTGEDDKPLKAKKPRGRKRRVQQDSSDEDEVLLKPTSMSVENAGDMEEDDDTDEDYKPRKTKKPSRKRKVQKHSSGDDDAPLKPKSLSGNDGVGNSEEDSDADEEDDKPLKAQKPRSRKRKVKMDSSEDDDIPLKQKTASVKDDGEDNEKDDDTDESDQPLMKNSSSRKTKVQKESSDEDDVPLKPKSLSVNRDVGDSSEEQDRDEEDDKPLKPKSTHKSSRQTTLPSDDDGSPPVRTQRNGSEVSGSGTDTSSLSSDDEPLVAPAKGTGPNIKFTMKKDQKQNQGGMQVKTKAKSSKIPSADAASEESSYLKRLRLICRKVGIFVRNDVHFVGCTTDKQKVERLKDALKQAGMKGQPSLSKVDSVNLRREAEALDTTNIIETSGRPKRQPKTLFSRTDSPKKSLTPVKQQFSRIRDLISESESE